jgi:HPr kinase/phosphorylase
MRHGETLPTKQDTARESKKPEQGKTTVRDLISVPELGLDLEIMQDQGLENQIRSARIQKLGMALAGFTGYLHPDRIQIFGSSEQNYLKTLDSDARPLAIQHLKRNKVCCILVTKGLDVPDALINLSREEKIPILRSHALSSVCVEKISGYLEKRLASRMTIHGVLLEVFGLGVLLLGPSGIGKSECALELVLKGHRLISDDFVELTKIGLDALLGSGGDVLKHHMELRGLGIINIKELFGISATGTSHTVDFAVKLERWKSDAEYDRLGFDQSKIEFMGVPLPLIDMPVAPGRNVSTLVEVAARIHLLRQRGYNPMKEIDD